LLLGADDGQYDEELVSMAEKVVDDTNEVEKHFDDSDDDSIANESCHILLEGRTLYVVFHATNPKIFYIVLSYTV
jgi:hypothetical protein